MSDGKQPTPWQRSFPICKDHHNADWNEPTLDDDACVLCRMFYLEAQESLLEEWQQRAKRAEDAIKEIERPLDAQMARLNETVVHLNDEIARLRSTQSESTERTPFVAGLDPATMALVCRFAQALAEKLKDAQIKYGYSDMWTFNNWRDECQERLAEHVKKGDPRDVAAYCAFMWHHGWPTTPQPKPANDRAWPFPTGKSGT